MKAKLLLLALAAVFASSLALPVYAQGGSTNDTVVSACGTPYNTPVVGQQYPGTQDTTLKKCVNATVSATATVALIAKTTTNGSSTVTAGGTFQSALASNGSRTGCLIQNPVTATENLFVFFGTTGSATTANSISLGAGSAVSCSIGGIAVATDNIAVSATTTGHAFVVMSQ